MELWRHAVHHAVPCAPASCSPLHMHQLKYPPPWAPAESADLVPACLQTQSAASLQSWTSWTPAQSAGPDPAGSSSGLERPEVPTCGSCSMYRLIAAHCVLPEGQQLRADLALCCRLTPLSVQTTLQAPVALQRWAPVGSTLHVLCQASLVKLDALLPICADRDQAGGAADTAIAVCVNSGPAKPVEGLQSICIQHGAGALSTTHGMLHGLSHQWEAPAHSCRFQRTSGLALTIAN